MVTHSSYYAKVLEQAKPGSGMRMIYETNLEKVEGDVGVALDRVIDEPKTLMFYGSNLVFTGERKRKLALIKELVLDYYHTTIGALALQRDSEFLQLFNHYTLKAYMVFNVSFFSCCLPVWPAGLPGRAQATQADNS